MNFLTPLARARAFGSARSGVQDWWRQRITALGLIPVSLWLAWWVAGLPRTGHAELVSWIARPWNAVLLLSFMGLAVFHAMLGVRVVIEDYIHAPSSKVIGILIIKLILGFTALVAGYAILRITFAS